MYDIARKRICTLRKEEEGKMCLVCLSASASISRIMERSHSQRNVVSLPNTDFDYLIDKLMVLRRYSLFVSLYSFIVVKDLANYFINLFILNLLSSPNSSSNYICLQIFP